MRYPGAMAVHQEARLVPGGFGPLVPGGFGPPVPGGVGPPGGCDDGVVLGGRMMKQEGPAFRWLDWGAGGCASSWCSCSTCRPPARRREWRTSSGA